MEVETRPQPGEGTAAGLVIALALAHFLLQPAREQGAYGGAFLGSENSSLLEELGFNFQGDIRFCSLHACTYFRVARFYVLRSGNSSRPANRARMQDNQILFSAYDEILKRGALSQPA